MHDNRSPLKGWRAGALGRPTFRGSDSPHWRSRPTAKQSLAVPPCRLTSGSPARCRTSTAPSACISRGWVCGNSAASGTMTVLMGSCSESLAPATTSSSRFAAIIRFSRRGLLRISWWSTSRIRPPGGAGARPSFRRASRRSRPSTPTGASADAPSSMPTATALRSRETPGARQRTPRHGQAGPWLITPWAPCPNPVRSVQRCRGDYYADGQS